VTGSATEPALFLGLDLRAGDIRLAYATAGSAPASLVVQAAAAVQDGRQVVGEEAVRALTADPGSGWTGLLDRVGDPVPVRLGPSAATASDLVARAIADALPGPVAELRAVAPASWGPRRRAALAASLAAAGLPAPAWVDELDAVGPDHALVDGDERALLLSMGAASTTARVLAPAGAGWRVEAVGDVPFGASDVADATTARLTEAATQAAGRPLTDTEARTLAAIAAQAADRLPGARRLEVLAPGLPRVRVKRGDIEADLGPRAQGAFAALPAALAALGVSELPRRVLAEGPGSRLPAMTAALAAALGRPVEAATAVPAALLAHVAGDAPLPPALAAPAATPDAAVEAPLEPLATPDARVDAPLEPLAAGALAATAASTPVSTPVPPPSRPAGAPITYGYAATPPARRERRGLKLAAAGLGLAAVLVVGGATIAGLVMGTLQGALAPAAPPAIPAGGTSATSSAALATPSGTPDSPTPSASAAPSPAPTTPAAASTSTSKATTQTTTTKAATSTTTRSTTKATTTTSRTTTTRPATTTRTTTRTTTTTTTPPPTSTTTTATTPPATTTTSTPPASTTTSSAPPSSPAGP